MNRYYHRRYHYDCFHYRVPLALRLNEIEQRHRGRESHGSTDSVVKPLLRTLCFVTIIDLSWNMTLSLKPSIVMNCILSELQGVDCLVHTRLTAIKYRDDEITVQGAGDIVLELLLKCA